MTVGEIAAIIIACMTALGLMITWGKTSRENIEQRTKMETNLKSEIKVISDDVKHPEHGLSAINKKVEEQALYCARTSTSFKEKIGALERKSQ